MPNTIHYSPEALADMDETYEYIRFELQNPIAAKNTIEGIRNSIAELKTLDNIGVKVFLPNGLETVYHFIQFKKYLIFYRQVEHDVFIDRIMHGSRDYINILFGSEIK